MELIDIQLEAEMPAYPRSYGKPATSSAAPVVFVVDDDVSVLDALAPLASSIGWRLEAFASASEFLARARPSVPTCVVLDMELADASGLDMRQHLADHPGMPVICVSGCGDVRTAVRAMKAGAVEFLTKPLAAELLLSAMRHAIERSRAALARQAGLDALRQRYASLTCRERDVMALIVCGRLNKQAGAELGISEITVKAHRGKMMRKMGARSLPDLVNLAAKLFPTA